MQLRVSLQTRMPSCPGKVTRGPQQVEVNSSPIPHPVVHWLVCSYLFCVGEVGAAQDMGPKPAATVDVASRGIAELGRTAQDLHAVAARLESIEGTRLHSLAHAGCAARHTMPADYKPCMLLTQAAYYCRRCA